MIRIFRMPEQATRSLTDRAKALLEQGEARKWRIDGWWELADLTDADISSMPPHILPGIKYARDCYLSTTNYRWIDPWANR